MSALAASSLGGPTKLATAIERRAEDRWKEPNAAGQASALMSFVLVASISTHAGLLATAFWADRRTDVAPPKEISVEVVQEPAKPPTKAPASTPPPPPSKPAEMATPNPLKAVQRKAAAAIQPKPQPRSVPRTDKVDLEALRKQLETLKAERAALDEQAARRPIPAKAEVPLKSSPSPMERMRTLLGEPPLGLGAAALPGESEAGTEAASYKQLVLSRVAKAKKEGRYRGIPGYATVAFLIDDKGSVATSKIERESGDPSLDKEAIDMISRGAPYPPPPPGAQRSFVLTLQFRPTP